MPDLSRLPLKLALPTVLQALASFLVLHAVIATFSFGDKKMLNKNSNSGYWWLKISIVMQLMQQNKNSADWYVQFGKNQEKHHETFFLQKCPLMGHFGLFFLI